MIPSVGEGMDTQGLSHTFDRKSSLKVKHYLIKLSTPVDRQEIFLLRARHEACKGWGWKHCSNSKTCNQPDAHLPEAGWINWGRTTIWVMSCNTPEYGWTVAVECLHGKSKSKSMYTRSFLRVKTWNKNRYIFRIHVEKIHLWKCLAKNWGQDSGQWLMQTGRMRESRDWMQAVARS